MNVLLAASLIVGTALAGAPPERVKTTISVTPGKARPGERVDLVIDCAIQSGWHIYSPDFQGTGTPTSLKLEPGPLVPDGKLGFPKPKERRDKVLSEDVRYFEGKVQFKQPLKLAGGTPPGKVKVTGKLSYQACTESVCDLPREVPVEAEVEVLPAGAPASAPPAAPPEAPPALPGLPGLGEGGAAGPPRAEFNVRVEPAKVPAGGRGEVVVQYDVPPGAYIYPPDLKGEIGRPTRIVLDGKLALPAGEAITKPPPTDKVILGEKHRVLEGKGEVRQHFTLSAALPEGKTTLPVTVEHMVCNDKTCLPGDWNGKAVVEVTKADASGLFGLMFLAILGGLGALIMPCTYPMIPITISYFTKQAEVRKTGVLSLALAYGAGIVVDFVLIGLLVGAPIVAFSQHWLTNSVFAILFVVFGLSLLGLYEIRLPGVFNTLAGNASGVRGYLGVFLLGATLVITSFTCSFPIIGIMLATGAQARSFLEVVLGMSVFGLTMAVPFVALAMFPARVRSLPRSGEWMHTLKVTLGLVELAAALKFISMVDVVLEWKALPRETFLYIVAAIALTTALYLFALIRLKGETAEIGPARMMFGMLFLIFSFYCIYGAQGNRLDWIMSAFAPPYSANPVAAGKGAGAKLRMGDWTLVEDDFEGGLARAKQEGKLALLNWTGIT